MTGHLDSRNCFPSVAFYRKVDEPWRFRRALSEFNWSGRFKCHLYAWFIQTFELSPLKQSVLFAVKSLFSSIGCLSLRIKRGTVVFNVAYPLIFSHIFSQFKSIKIEGIMDIFSLFKPLEFFEFNFHEYQLAYKDRTRYTALSEAKHRLMRNVETHKRTVLESLVHLQHGKPLIAFTIRAGTCLLTTVARCIV